MAPRLVGLPAWQFFNDTGGVLASGTLNFYVPGTSTDKNIYTSTDSGGSTHTNVHTLDSAGRPTGPMFGDGLYDIVVKDSLGNTITTILNWGDNNSAIAASGAENLVLNGSFETDDNADNVPDNWTMAGDESASITRITSDQTHGAACLRFDTVGSGDETATSSFMPVSPNQQYSIDFEYYASNASATPKVDIAYYDEAQASTSTTTVFEPASSAISWERVSGLRFTPPAGSYYAKVVIYGNQAVTEYTTYWDDVRVLSIADSRAPYAVSGMNMSIDTDTDHDINVTAGICRNSDFTVDIELETEITKQIDASWAAGDDAGGLFTGSSLPASGRLGVYAIKNTSTGEVDVGFDDDAFLSPTLPAGYDAYRYLGSVITNASSNLVSSEWHGAKVTFLDDLELEINDTTVADAVLETATINTPPLAEIKYLLGVDMSGGSAELIVFVRPADASWAATKFGVGNEHTNAELDEIRTEGYVRVDSSSQIDYGVDHGASTVSFFNLYMIGWEDYKRDNP